MRRGILEKIFAFALFFLIWQCPLIIAKDEQKSWKIVEDQLLGGNLEEKARKLTVYLPGVQEKEILNQFLPRGSISFLWRNNAVVIEYYKPFLEKGKIINNKMSIDFVRSSKRPFESPTMNRLFYFSDDNVDVYYELLKIGMKSEDQLTRIKSMGYLLEDYKDVSMVELLKKECENADFANKLQTSAFLINHGLNEYQEKLFPEILKKIDGCDKDNLGNISNFLTATKEKIQDKYFYPIIELLLRKKCEFKVKLPEYPMTVSRNYKMLASLLLESHDNQKDMPYVEELLKIENPEIHANALTAQAILKGKDGLPALMQGFNSIQNSIFDPYDFFYTRADVLLEHFSLNEIKDALKDLNLEKTNEDLKRYDQFYNEKQEVLQLLAWEGDKESLEELKRLSLHGDFKKRILAADDLITIAGPETPVQVASILLDEMEMKIKDRGFNISLYENFVSELSRSMVFDPEIEKRIEKLLDNPDEKIQLQAACYILRYNYYMEHNKDDNATTNQ